jgi:hypothetical protein
MHLTSNTGETPIDRRFIGHNGNYPLNDGTTGQRRVSTAATQLLRCRASIDSCGSNGTSMKRVF